MSETNGDPPRATAPAEPAILIDTAALAALLGTTDRNLRRLMAAGRLPAPVLVGRRKRWRRKEVEAWVDADCPARARWEAIRKAGRKA